MQDFVLYESIMWLLKKVDLVDKSFFKEKLLDLM